MVQDLSSRLKGFKYERELCKLLWRNGFAVIRAPASGSRLRKWYSPDVIALRRGKIYLFEVKSISGSRKVYVKKYTVYRLRKYMERSGGEAFIAVKRITTGQWILVPITELEDCGEKYYLVREEKGFSLEAFLHRN